MKSMSEAAEIKGRHTNHSVRRTMISMLRKENVEPLDITALAGQKNLKSLDSYSSTSMEQQKEMSVKLSNYIQAREAPEKSLVESQVLSPRPIPQMEPNRCSLELFSRTANSILPLLMLPSPPIMPQSPQCQRRNSKESCPSLTVMRNCKRTFCPSELSEVDFTTS